MKCITTIELIHLQKIQFCIFNPPSLLIILGRKMFYMVSLMIYGVLILQISAQEMLFMDVKEQVGLAEIT